MRSSSKHRLCVAGGLALCLLLFGPAQALYAQQQAATDSLRQRLEAMEEGPERAHTLRRLAWEHVYSHPDSAIQYARRALDLARQVGSQEDTAACLSIMGTAYRLQGRFSRALNYFTRAREGYAAAHFRQGVANSLNDLGSVYANLGDLPKALNYYFRSVKVFEELGDEDGIALCLSNIGIVHRQQGNLKQALSYYDRAIRLNEKLGNRVALAETYNNIGNVYQSQRKYDKAMTYYEDALNVFKEEGNQLGVASAHSNLGSALGRQGLYDKALEHLFESARVSRAAGGKRHLAATYDHIGRIYRETGELESALRFAEKAFTVAKDIESERLVREAALTLSEVHAARKDYESAYHYYQRHSAAKDSLYSAEKASVIARMQTRYETEQKEQQIENLKQERRIQALRAQRQQWMRNGLMGGLVLVLLLAGVLYNRYRFKGKANRLLEARKEEVQASLEEKELLVKEVHHRVKNNLQVISSLIGLQAQTLDEPRSLAAIRNVRDRVEAMALVHRKLYKREDLTRVDLQDYLEELSAFLFEAFAVDEAHTRCRVRAEGIELKVGTAVPLGLITNELVSNALEHAFPDGEDGTIQVTVRECRPRRFVFRVEDDGVGLPEAVRERPGACSPTVGLTLVEDLTRQIGGAMAVENGVGVTYTIRFTEEA